MYTRMLIPLDGSNLAEQVLPYARFLAKELTIPVDLMEIVDPEGFNLLANTAHRVTFDRLLTERRESCEAYLGGVARSFSGANVECHALYGKPEEVIVEKAAEDKNTLIIMATHGRTGIQRWMLGSVAEKVLIGASNNLLLVRAAGQGNSDGEARLKTVVIPLDGSPLAEQVLPQAIELASKMKLKVIFVRAYALPVALASDEYAAYIEELVNRAEDEARDYIAEKVQEFKDKGVVDVESVVSFGYGAEEIITLARKTPDNVVAMCTHGRTGIGKWVLGSVTDKVVRDSGDPVLIIRAI